MSFINSISAYLILQYVLISTSEGIKYSSINETYKKGVDAYLGERWSECIIQFEDVLHLYKLYRSTTINCRQKCSSQQDISNIKYNIEDLKVFEMFIKRRNCLIMCKENSFHDLKLDIEVNDDTLEDLQNRKPYEYLHMCYYQMYRLPKAATACYTYLSAHPTDPVAMKNLEYYVDQPEVDENELTDLESDDYIVLHRLGDKAYHTGNWRETIAAMEEVLSDYLSSENNCRVDCEQMLQQELLPGEFIDTITKNIKFLLECKQRCQNKLKKNNFQSGRHFLADILNYLQISYYHLDKIKEAAKVVTSYLLMFPEDEDMLENKRIYMSLIDQDSFTELPDIYNYFNRDMYEKNLLNQLLDSETENNVYK